jgi:hypothetical protein
MMSSCIITMPDGQIVPYGAEFLSDDVSVHYHTQPTVHPSDLVSLPYP